MTRSYWPGLFACYDEPDLPRTNRKVACPGTVVRGSVRLLAATATHLRSIEVAELVPSDLSAWRDVRGGFEQRQRVRRLESQPA